jgi:cytochrome c-type biogenesis protein
MTDVSYPLAFLAGVISFLSPCVLPLVPSYISFITGVSFEDLADPELGRQVRARTLVNSLVFILGFSVVFIALGASSSLIGELLFEYQDWLRIGGGILVIIFGLFISGIIKLDFLLKEKKFHFRGRPAGYVGTFLIGIVFAAGWTPCIGPVLGSILLVASSQGSATYGVQLLTVYSLGLGLPFLVSAMAFNSFLSYSRTLQKHMKVIMVISGIILILFGIILLTNNLGTIATWFPDIGIEL